MFEFPMPEVMRNHDIVSDFKEFNSNFYAHHHFCSLSSSLNIMNIHSESNREEATLLSKPIRGISAFGCGFAATRPDWNRVGSGSRRVKTMEVIVSTGIVDINTKNVSIRRLGARVVRT